MLEPMAILLGFLEDRGPVPEHVVKRIVDFATMNPTYKALQNDGLFGQKRWDSGA